MTEVVLTGLWLVTQTVNLAPQLALPKIRYDTAKIVVNEHVVGLCGHETRSRDAARMQE